MKKIISLGVASAICALTAISASAAPASYVQKGEIAKDNVITIDVMAGQDTTGLSFKVEAEGLEVQDVKSPASGVIVNTYNKDAKTFMLSAGTGKVVAKAGEVICTITAKVTADAGKEVSVALVDASGKYTAFLPDAVYKDTVKGATTNPGTSTPGTSTPGTSTPGTSTPSKPSSGNDNDNPDTGVALAVIPAVLAAAGVVVAKKRK